MKSDRFDFGRCLPRALGMLGAAVAMTATAAIADSGAGVWSKDSNGWPRHVQSGFTCPGNLASLTLSNVIVGSTKQPPGEQVGCEYEDGSGSWASVEVTRLSPSESVSAHAVALRGRLQARYPGILRQADQSNWRPKSPSGGDTFSAGYYNVTIGGRRAVLAVAGGEVGGWMLSIVQLGYTKDSADIQLAAIANWQAIATTRP